MRITVDDPPLEYAFLPSLLDQIRRKLAPKGIFWQEISKDSKYYHSEGTKRARKKRRAKARYRRVGFR